MWTLKSQKKLEKRISRALLENVGKIRGTDKSKFEKSVKRFKIHFFIQVIVTELCKRAHTYDIYKVRYI